VVGRGEKLPGLIEEDFSLVGEGDLSAVAMQQLDADLSFEVGDLFADRGLGDVKSASGVAESLPLGDSDEISEVA
jgi:hypothetical protein